MPTADPFKLWIASLPAQPCYAVGVDGGGTGTRAKLQDIEGRTLGQGTAGPSALGLGVAQAWRHIEESIAGAFAAAGLASPGRAHLALGLGLAGSGREEARRAFLAADPGYARCALHSDAITLLVGAHAGRAGIVVAAGTGSVAAMQDTGGRRQLIGGWGFPVGDEGSGAWLGLRAVGAAQAAIDGRGAPGAMTRSVLERCGPGTDLLQSWCLAAGQHEYAQVAPLVFSAAEAGDPQAQAMLQAAADALARHVQALQASAGEPLPVVVGGSVGQRLAGLWPQALREHIVLAAGDSADGALHLLRQGLVAAATPSTLEYRKGGLAEHPKGCG